MFKGKNVKCYVSKYYDSLCKDPKLRYGLSEIDDKNCTLWKVNHAFLYIFSHLFLRRY